MLHFHTGTVPILQFNPVHRLIVAPHADDEVLGCGGMLAKFPEDSAVVVLVRPDDLRLKELEEAQNILGYREAHILDFEDGYLGVDDRLLTSVLDSMTWALKPQELYLPFPSMHQDHIAAYRAGIRSARLSMGKQHWFTPNVYVYDVAAYDINVEPTDLRWNIFEPLEEAHIDKKVEAINMYADQIAPGLHPVNGVKEIAHALGISRQVRWAEQFALVRGVRA